jgi:hypothetical protein
MWIMSSASTRSAPSYPPTLSAILDQTKLEFNFEYKIDNNILFLQFITMLFINR